MNLVEFLDCRFQELKWETDKTDKFHPVPDAELKATHEILTRYRTALKWVMLPKVLYDYARVQLGLREEPVPILLNMIRAKKAEEDAAKEKKVAETMKNVSSFSPVPDESEE